jgi:hypothetical protein
MLSARLTKAGRGGGLSHRLLNLAERGGSGAQHTARAAVGRIAEARARGDTDIAAPSSRSILEPMRASVSRRAWPERR